ncbi:MAG TPA: IS21 family transposase [Chitinophagaceae bacterium]|nr:IS21 family transposase [Chitinophagaceae bacterium]
MNQAKQVLQLRKDGVPIKQIAQRTGISRKTVRKYLRRMEVLPLQKQEEKATPVSSGELAAVIYNDDTVPCPGKRIQDVITHFEYAKNELPKTGVTRQLLWIEYLNQYPGGYQYSQYCDLLRKYLKNTHPAFHWEYPPGEFIQVDFAGKKLSFQESQQTKAVKCQVFVGVLPFSGLIFCMAVLSQKTTDFITCIKEMLRYFAGVTKTILCDNMKTAVIRADRYEPVFTDMCHQLSDHYGTTFSATRPASPTDKGMVEKAVDIVYNHIYGPMHKQTPVSLEDLNYQIRQWLDILNLKPYKGTAESRRDIFVSREASLLKELPQTSFSFKKCKEVTVQRNYAIQLPDNKHYYTVPYKYVGSKVLAYFDSRTVEIYYQHNRIAFHVRTSTEPQFNRIASHMPENHKHMLQMQGWTEEGLLERAGWVGEYTHQTCDRLLHSSIYPEQNYKACHVLILLQNKYTRERLEAACRRAANVIRPTLKLITNILKAGLDKQPMLFDEEHRTIPIHDNIRGPRQYQ